MKVTYCNVCKVRPAEEKNMDIEVATTLGVRVKMAYEPAAVKSDWNICPRCRAEALREIALQIEIRQVDTTRFDERSGTLAASLEEEVRKPVDTPLVIPEGKKLELV